MAVIVMRTVDLEGSAAELRVFLPSGSLTRTERQQAERLDEVLREQVPRLAASLTEAPSDSTGLLRRRYEFGVGLRKIVDDPELVSRPDVLSGDVWEAVWQYLPKAARPQRSQDDDSYADRESRRKGFFSLCYEISAYDWEDVGWIQRWTDWYEIASRPGVLRDRRVLPRLALEIRKRRRYPSASGLQSILKNLAAAFPTRRLRDSSILDDDAIEEAVVRAVKLAEYGNEANGRPSVDAG